LDVVVGRLPLVVGLLEVMMTLVDGSFRVKA
jgi:hypothetical protein